MQAAFAGMIGGMIRIETHKIIPFVLFFVITASFFILPYFSQVELPEAAMSAFGSETIRAEVTEIIEEGGHLINLTHADRVNRFIERCLDSC